MYLTLLYLTGALTLGAACFAYVHFRDVFHPLFLLSLLLSWPYCWSPLLLDQAGVLQRYLPVGRLPFVQLAFLVGVGSLLLGVLSAGKPRQIAMRRMSFSPLLRKQIRWAGIVLGLCGIAAYFYTVYGAGGFDAVYGVVHGRSSYGSGWVRDASTLTVPGLLLVLLSNSGRRMGLSDWILVAAIAAPMTFHGLVGSSRGVTFMIGVTLVCGWYMMRFRRPGLVSLLAGGAAFAFVIFSLAASRGEIYLGSDLSFSEPVSAIDSFITNNNPGQEYIYGAGSVIQAEQTARYQWGALYLIHLLIQPIPHEFWPTKYEDSARYLGIPTVGEANQENVSLLGWIAPAGAAAGMVADMWVQFWWFMVIPFFLVGRVYGTAWYRATSRGGLWTVVYVVLLAHSIFLTQQDTDAMLFKVIYICAFGWLAWHVLVDRTWVIESRRWRNVRQMALRPFPRIPESER